MAEPTRRGTWPLVAGGLLSALNGAAHFLLPLVYPAGGWGPHAEGLYEPVRWALYATMVFFGVLLVLAGALTVAVARAGDVPRARELFRRVSDVDGVRAFAVRES